MNTKEGSFYAIVYLINYYLNVKKTVIDNYVVVGFRYYIWAFANYIDIVQFVISF